MSRPGTRGVASPALPGGLRPCQHFAELVPAAPPQCRRNIVFVCRSDDFLNRASGVGTRPPLAQGQRHERRQGPRLKRGRLVVGTLSSAPPPLIACSVG